MSGGADWVDTWFGRCSRADGVVFDFGGVISVAPGDDYPVVASCAALGLSRAAFDKGWADYRHLWDGGFISCQEMYRRIFSDSGLVVPDAATLDRLYREDSSAWVRALSGLTLELMRRLKASGRKIGILTNMSDQFCRDYFAPRASAFIALADAVVVSGQHRLYKPERPIYDLMEKEIGVPAARLIFLDDTQKNVDAARRYGWQSEVYNVKESRDAKTF